MITIGTDMEVFVANSDNHIVSARSHVLGTKFKPHKVNFGAIQEDGVTAEFHIDPAYSLDEFVHNIKIVYATITDVLLQHNLHPVIKASHVYSEDDTTDWQETEHRFVGIPEWGGQWNTWTKEKKAPPDGTSTLLRTCGGHIHIGYSDNDFETNYKIGKLMDIKIGIVSVLIDRDNERRELYGHAGTIRHKPYGVEYRTLSNFWLETDELMTWIYNTTFDVVSNTDYYDQLYSAIDGENIQQIINECLFDDALKMCEKLSLEIPSGYI